MKPRARLGVAAFVALCFTASPALAAGCTLGVMAALPVTMEGMRASIPLKVNGRDTSFWLDSGAFFSIMSKAKAAELGLRTEPLPQGFYLVGIGGSASAELTTVRSLGIVGQEIHDVQFLVGGSDAGNGLIGRNILALADTEFDLAGGSVKLIRPHGCDKQAMSYWAPGKPAFSVPLERGSNPYHHEFRVRVSINGQTITAELDSGSPMSLLSRKAAERAGIDLAGPQAIRASGINGLGRRFHDGWTVPVAAFAIGEEQILRTHLSVIDGPITEEDGPDMLLGADFMMAHHIYVARAQGMVYFTYSGGRPFLTEHSAPAAPTAATPAAAVPTGLHRVHALAASAEPKTADEFARRAHVRLTQAKTAEAISDLTAAIGLAPRTASYYGDRARAYFESERPLLARADLDRALTLDPDSADLLRLRGRVRLHQHDEAGALSDTTAAARFTPPSSFEGVEVAHLYVALHRPALAIPVLDAVIAAHREDSRFGMLLNERCWARALANVELDKALDDCNHAIRRDGAKAPFLDSRALVEFRQGQLARSIADYDAALKLAPQLAWSLYMRGAAKMALGQAEGKADQSAAERIRPGIAEEVKADGIGAPPRWSAAR